MSVYQAIKLAKQQALHPHYCDPGMLDWLASMFGESAPVVRHGREAASCIVGATADAPVSIVTMVRTPIERNISAWFENKGALAADDLSECMRLFIDKYNHYVAIDWLDMELKKVIGLDVYADPFDQQSGFRVYNAGRFRVLLFRSDLDRNRQGDLVSDFLGKRVAIGDINVGAEKPYASEYRAFLEQIRPPEEYVDWMLDSRYAQHFWPPSTLDCLKKFWLRRVVSESTN